jgi:hypothetical protein
VVGEEVVMNGYPVAAAPGYQPIEMAATPLACVIKLACQRRFLKCAPLNGYVGRPGPKIYSLILGP